MRRVMEVVRWWSALALCALAGAAAAQTLAWKNIPGTANDIGVGADGTVWIIGTDKPAPNDYGIYKLVNGNWQKMPGWAVRVAVDPKGNAWIINSTHNVFHWNGSSWDSNPGRGLDIGVGANGDVWLIGEDHSVWKWDPAASWQKKPGGGDRIAVDPQGNAWITNANHDIFHWNGSGWVQVPGGAIDIGVGANGAVFIVGNDGSVWNYDGRGWVKRDGILTNISVDPKGMPWGVNAGKGIWQATAASRMGANMYRSRGTILLRTGDVLKSGEYIVSNNHKFLVAMQDDANLCIYQGAVFANQVWCSGSSGAVGEYRAAVQSDGNLCIAPGSAPTSQSNMWCASKWGRDNGTYTLRMGDNGNLVVWVGEPLTNGSVWSYRYGSTPPSSYIGTLVMNNTWKNAGVWVTTYQSGQIMTSGCLEAGMSGSWQNIQFGNNGFKIRTEVLAGTDGNGGDCSSGKFCDTDMGVDGKGTTGGTHIENNVVYSHQNAANPKGCYISLRQKQDVWKATVKNKYTNRAVWVTFYDYLHQGVFSARKIFLTGCVTPGQSQQWVHDWFQGGNYVIRAEVMAGTNGQGNDCNGAKVCDTDANPGYAGTGSDPDNPNPNYIYPNGSNCYIDWK